MDSVGSYFGCFLILFPNFHVSACDNLFNTSIYTFISWSFKNLSCEWQLFLFFSLYFSLLFL